MPRPEENAISKVKSDINHAGKDAENNNAIDDANATNADMFVILTNSFGLFEDQRITKAASILPIFSILPSVCFNNYPSIGACSGLHTYF